MIVRFNDTTNVWEDPLGRDWSGAVKFELPDLDVFAIDASAPVPVETASFAHVGTVLFNMATNPVTGAVYVTNTEAHNEIVSRARRRRSATPPSRGTCTSPASASSTAATCCPVT